MLYEVTEKLYLIVLSQRISRYPLFMSAMLDHMTKDSEESLHLKGMET